MPGSCKALSCSKCYRNIRVAETNSFICRRTESHQEQRDSRGCRGKGGLQLLLGPGEPQCCSGAGPGSPPPSRNRGLRTHRVSPLPVCAGARRALTAGNGRASPTERRTALPARPPSPAERGLPRPPPAPPPPRAPSSLPPPPGVAAAPPAPPSVRVSRRSGRGAAAASRSGRAPAPRAGLCRSAAAEAEAGEQVSALRSAWQACRRDRWLPLLLLRWPDGWQIPDFHDGWCCGNCMGTFFAILGLQSLQGKSCWSEKYKEDFSV